ncbi:putative NPP1 domain protein [Mycena olivaceomarginata]|nr:putative NPP1 domain protein [Mycena olivaceomarginata]
MSLRHLLKQTIKLGLLAVVAASPLSERAVIDSDAVVGFLQTVPASTAGSVYLAYKPHLKVVNGCVPFPAVDAAGNTGGGLNPTGATNGGCSSSTGQVYVRSGTSNGRFGLLYSWYFPKDEPSDGLGHKHDWEGCIVWLASSTSTSAANILAVCPSAHGGWNCSTDDFSLTGTSPLIQYESIIPTNHAMGLTTTSPSGPLIAWESLPAAAQAALQTTDFGVATVPFKDSTLASNLAAATF